MLFLPHLAVAAPVKLSTWNLDWLTSRSQAAAELPDDVQPRPDADFVRLRAYADKLDADVVAFQEVDGASTAARVFDPARYTLLTIAEPVVQQVGLAVRHGITIVRHSDVTALDVEPEAKHPLRDGLDATLGFSGGGQLRLLVIHLKSGCQTGRLASTGHTPCALLARQIPPLAAWVRARAAEHVAFAVIGDFNRDMDDPEELGQALAQAAALTRATEGKSNPCWEGDDFIDHILLGGPARGWLVPGSLRVLTYRETDPAMQPHLSDHCPVSVSLAVSSDN